MVHGSKVYLRPRYRGTCPNYPTSRDLIARFARSCSSHLTHVVLFATIGQHPREARNPGSTPVHDIGRESVHWEQDPENRGGSRHVSRSCTAADRTKSGSQSYSGSRYSKVSTPQALPALL